MSWSVNRIASGMTGTTSSLSDSELVEGLDEEELCPEVKGGDED